MDEVRRTEADLRWRPSPLTLAIITCAAVALAAATAFARWQLIAFVAPLLGVVATIGWQRPTSKVYVHARPELQRCFEAERTETTVWVSTEGGDVAVDLRVSGIEGMTLDVVDTRGREEETVSASAQRWGRYRVRAHLEATPSGGLLTGTATVEAAEIYVFPLAPPHPTGLPRTELPDRLGTHLTRHIGPGVEYADVRAYLPGDHLRTINWPVSARRGSLHVTQRLTDRAADVVVLIDMSAQAPGPATAATERTATGAAQVVQTALRNGDRAGIVGL
ncbi:MAG TPA: DUF58 domain-containing protein, partial [Mycobacterium sp.]|nr:DUF58 domain-containing protein [Mycobacterium sp.]